MSVMKIEETVKNKLQMLKNLHKKKSLNAVVEELIDSEIRNYCYTMDGLVKIGMLIEIDGDTYTVIDINEEYVFARNNITVIEFHKRGKIAWNARIINE